MRTVSVGVPAHCSAPVYPVGVLVMGGRSQHDWEHTVPKTTRGGRGSASPTGTPQPFTAPRR